MEHKVELLRIDDEIKTYKLNNKKNVPNLNVYDDNQLLKLGKQNEEVLTAVRTIFDEPKKGTKEYEHIGFSLESKKAVVDELNQNLFGKTREIPVIQYDIDDTLLENIVKAIETNDIPTAMKLLEDPVLQYKWDAGTFKEMYHRVNESFDYTKYNLPGKLTNDPYTGTGTNKKYFNVKDIPELIAKYEMGELEYGDTLTRVAQNLGIAPKSMVFEDDAVKKTVDNLKSIPLSFFEEYQKKIWKEKRMLADITGDRDIRMSVANRNAYRDATEALRKELRNDNLTDLPEYGGIKYDQYFDYKDIDDAGSNLGKTIPDIGKTTPEDIVTRSSNISDATFQKMYDFMKQRISDSLGGKQIEQVTPEELNMFRDIDELENNKFGIRGGLIESLTKSTDIADEYIEFMKKKGKDTRIKDKNINKYENILYKLKDNA